MFSIGDFARLAGVSVRTLRYYEEVGLLAPAAVDDATGYRSYTARQLPRVHRIVALKELGLSLGEIGPLLDDLDAARLEGLLVAKRAELADRIATERARLERVERRLRMIQREGQMPTDVVLKQIPSIRVAAVRATETSPTFDDVPPIGEDVLRRLADAVGASHVRQVKCEGRGDVVDVRRRLTHPVQSYRWDPTPIATRSHRLLDNGAPTRAEPVADG